MAIMKYTMNQITMLSLTLMVGVVVDDAIIVLENIYRYMEEKGLSEVVFDRGVFNFHGRVKAIADGLRKGGIKF